MHKNIITKNIDANIANARFDVTGTKSGAKRGGFGAACMRFTETLRRLASMLRHLRINSHTSGSAHQPHGSEQIYLFDTTSGQATDGWHRSEQDYSSKCLKQANKCLKPALVTVPSLVTT